MGIALEGRIDLAHEAPFALGRLTVRPALRQIVRDDGASEVVEPRVMQVLVALARADGEILSRDDLTRCCWEGRVVGEDAINRVISRLRRVAEGIGEGAFRIETITKVGYRLVGAERTAAEAANPTPALASALADARRLRLDRRAMLIGSGLAVVAVGSGTALWRRSAADAMPPSDIAPLLQQARLAGRQGTVEGANQAMGLLRRVTEMRPDYADGWGLLALNYAGAAGGLAPEMEASMRTRARDALGRALALDGSNPYARLALSMLEREPGSWRKDEALARAIVQEHPRLDIGWGWLGGVLLSVGRCREAADAFVRLAQLGPPDPASAYTRVVALWAANRLDEADKAASEGAALFPSHFAVWFTRFYLLLYTGRPADALAMSRNVNYRPPGLPDANFELVETVAQAMLTRDAGDIDKAVASALLWSHRGAGFAENGIQFAAALGRVDTAFEIAGAYYFGRGFETGDLRFQPEQRTYTRRGDRRTRLLFMPSTAAMRGDPRFDALVTELGLKRYWKDNNTPPDYLRG